MEHVIVSFIDFLIMGISKSAVVHLEKFNSFILILIFSWQIISIINVIIKEVIVVRVFRILILTQVNFYIGRLAMLLVC